MSSVFAKKDEGTVELGGEEVITKSSEPDKAEVAPSDHLCDRCNNENCDWEPDEVPGPIVYCVDYED